jgi:hypothetical protein
MIQKTGGEEKEGAGDQIYLGESTFAATTASATFIKRLIFAHKAIVTEGYLRMILPNNFEKATKDLYWNMRLFNTFSIFGCYH